MASKRQQDILHEAYRASKVVEWCGARLTSPSSSLQPGLCDQVQELASTVESVALNLRSLIADLGG